MEDQLELMNEYDREISIGTDIEGEIIQKTSEGINVALVGYGKDGVIPKKELTNSDDVEMIFDNLNIGDNIKARVIKYRDDNGYVVLSRLEYERDEILAELEDLFNNKTTFTVKVKEAKEKGVVAYFKGVRIFIPASQIDIRFISDKSEFVNKEIEIRLIDFNKDNLSKIVASRRILLEEKQLKLETEVWSKLKVGDVVKAEIKRFTNFGAFAEINGVDGLIHLSQISWGHVKSASDCLKVGQIVDVKIIALDLENKKISLSIKELTPEPWSNITEKYPEGSIVLGKVVRLNDFGAFVELEPGVDALVHISKISHNRINHPSEVLSIGEEVKAKIIDIDTDKKRIGLSIKDIL